MSKRKLTVGLLSVFVIILIALYFLNSKLHFLADITEGPYTLFQKDNFAQVTWDTEPTTNEILKDGDTISTFAAQGQTEDVSFSVRPNEDLGEVQLDLTDLKMGDKVIPKENIEVLNLKVWPQCAPESANPNGNWIFNCNNANYKAPRYNEALYRTISKNLPELLVKNNQQDLVAAETAWGMPPEVDQTFEADLKADKTHTFYLRIKIPDEAVSGDYSGRITLAKQTGSLMSWPPANIKLDLKVYPFKLTDSAKDIVSHVGYRIDDQFFQEGRQSIGLEKYGKYLDFLKASGFTSLLVYDYNNIDQVAKMMKQRGFKKIIWNAIPYPNGEWLNPDSIYNANTIQTKIQQIKDAGFEDVYVYGYDEPNTAAPLFKNIEYAKFIHQSGGKIAASITGQVFDISKTQLLLHDLAGTTPEQGGIDLPIYAAAFSNSALFGDYVGLYFDRSWSFPILNDVPSFQVFPRGETVNNSVAPAGRKYETALSKDSWHHIAGVWDGRTSQYKLYIDNESGTGFEYTYQTAVSPFGNNLPKNTNRTYIGAAIDAIKPLSNGKSRDGIVAFRGNIAGVKIYNQALTKQEIDQGTVVPKVNYDFSDGELVDKTGHYPACQKMTPDGGSIEFKDDNPVAGKKSLYFSGNKYGVAAIETPNSPHLDCGQISDNYGVSNSITVETWIKLPNESSITNINGSIIARLEAYDRPFGKIEDYLVGIRKGTVIKNTNTEYFYSQIWPEYGNLANKRGTSGFYLESVGLNGYSPYGLDSPFKSQGAKYYDDRDSAEKTMFAALPTKSGDPLITYQFEAFRTGVDDSRYMTLYNDSLAKVKAKDPARATEIDQTVQFMLDQYPYNMNGDNKSFVDQPNSYHQTNRKLVADKIVEMQDILNDKLKHIDRFNVEEGQQVKNNPYILSVKVKDTSKVEKVEYYIDNILIGTSTLPDVNGVFDCPWDTAKYHSVVKIIVYGTDGQTEEMTRNTTVDLSGGQESTNPIVAVLPKTGENNLKITVLNIWNNIKRAFGSE